MDIINPHNNNNNNNNNIIYATINMDNHFAYVFTVFDYKYATKQNLSDYFDVKIKKIIYT